MVRNALMLTALLVIVTFQLSLVGCKGNLVWDIDKIESPKPFGQ